MFWDTAVGSEKLSDCLLQTLHFDSGFELWISEAGADILAEKLFKVVLFNLLAFYLVIQNESHRLAERTVTIVRKQMLHHLLWTFKRNQVKGMVHLK